MVTDMNLTTVMSTQNQLMSLQIASERTQRVLDRLDADQYNLKNKLESAIATLKSAEADVAAMLGFDWHARNVRKSIMTSKTS